MGKESYYVLADTGLATICQHCTMTRPLKRGRVFSLRSVYMSDQVVEIDGIRYVPAMISEVLRVLAGLLRSPEEIDSRDYRHLRIHVTEQDDSGSGVRHRGVSFDEFAVTLAEMIAARIAATTRAPEHSEAILRPLSAREERVARLAGQVTISEVL
jgi:hypothetical protein